MKTTSKWLVLAAACGALLSTPAAAQDAAPLGRAFDARDQAILKRLPARELQRLNAKLQQAMALYYDNAYRVSLPLFQEVAMKAGTMDVLYWYGMAAYHAGAPDMAIPQFQAMLERNPELHRVRIDLAMALLQKGDREGAKTELARVAASNPPEALLASVNQALANIERMDRRTFASLRASYGLQYDNNINARADDLPTGLSTTQEKGFGGQLVVTGSVVHDPGQRGEYIWRNSATLYDLDYMDMGGFDYRQWELTTSLEHVSPERVVRLPLSYAESNYAHTHLSDTIAFAPEVTWMFDPATSLKLGYRYSREDYYLFSNIDQNNDTHTLSVAPQKVFKRDDGLTVVASVDASHTHRDARTNRYTYSEYEVAPRLVLSPKEGMTVMLGAKYATRDYGGNASSVGTITFPARRKDDRLSGSFSLAHKITDNISLLGSFTHYVNNSNTSIYDYHKDTVGISLVSNYQF